jgi:hypothetical protein
MGISFPVSIATALQLRLINWPSANSLLRTLRRDASGSLRGFASGTRSLASLGKVRRCCEDWRKTENNGLALAVVEPKEDTMVHKITIALMAAAIAGLYSAIVIGTGSLYSDF